MDTKSKSFKQSFAAKTLCVFLSLFFAFGSAFCTILAVGTVLFCGSFDCFGSEWELEQTGAYYKVLYSYVTKMRALSTTHENNDLVLKLQSEKEDFVNKTIKDFLDSKAKLIKGELTDYERKGTYELAGLDKETLTEILKTESLRDFLKYEDYTDIEMFPEHEFKIGIIPDGYEYSNTKGYLSYSYSEEMAREVVKNAYEQDVRAYFGLAYIYDFTNQLDKMKNLNYYVKNSDGTEFTNMENPAAELEALSGHEVYFTYSDSKLAQQGLDCCMEDESRSSFYSYYTGLDILMEDVPEGAQISFYISDKITYGDAFYRLNKGFEMFGAQNTILYVILALALFACAVISLIILLCLCGYVSNVEGIKLAWVDRIPTDIHLLLSLAFAGGFIAAAVFLCAYGLGGFHVAMDEAIIGDFLYSLPVTLAAAALCSLSWLVFTEWISSTVRLKKAKKSFFRRLLGVQILCFIGRVLKKLFKLIFYRTKKFKRNVVLVCILCLLFEILFISMAVAAFDTALVLVFIAAFIGFNCVLIARLLNYVEKLDEIINAASLRRAPNVDVNTLPKSLKSLVDSMSVTQAELDKAVDTAVRDERMKTELITNVSHDLKTPLTSIISYVDLLKRCNITDETALSYLSVLEERSARLKTLVEDLVEASKASSGNVTLNLTGLNLTELVLQATGEMGGDFENAGLELVFDEPAELPVVFADGQKTYRVIENLFNNARKYSVSGSRVYVDVSIIDNLGTMEIKNVSRHKLNISPEELTERFVRGDSSRTDGGSGLGLAIAKDLCELQGGMLKLEIDGDLFKATVCLPLYTGQDAPR